jgi:hypothetical protein
MSCRSLIARSVVRSAADSLRWYLFALRMFHEAIPISTARPVRATKRATARIIVTINFSLKVLLLF